MWKEYPNPKANLRQIQAQYSHHTTTCNIYKEPDEKGDVLVLMSGKEDILQTYQILEYKLEGRVHLIPLYSEILGEVYDTIFHHHGTARRCIISTNIAEASVTIPNIRYVVDTGFQKINIHDYTLGDRLIKYPISKENAIQRAGRAVRVMPGVCYRMYTQETYNTFMLESTPPEILQTNICSILLLLTHLNINNLNTFSLISSPPQNIIDGGYNLLFKLGAIDKERIITHTGKELIRIGIDPQLGKLILEGIRYNCIYETVLLASILSCDLNSVLSILNKCRTEIHYDIICENNDFLTLISLFKKILKKNGEFARNIINEVSLTLHKLLERLKMMKIPITYMKSVDDLNICLLRTFFLNIAKKSDRMYIDLLSYTKMKISKNSFCNDKYLLYYKKFYIQENNYMCFCAKDPGTVLKEVPDYFTMLTTEKSAFKEENETEKKIYKQSPHPKYLSINPYEDLYERFELEDEEEEQYL